MIKNTIVLVPFPFDDLSGVKVRPAVCLTNPIGSYEHVIIAFISSQTKGIFLKSDIYIEKGSVDWKGSGLHFDSLIRLHKMVTIPKFLIKRKLGYANVNLKSKIHQRIIDLFEG